MKVKQRENEEKEKEEQAIKSIKRGKHDRKMKLKERVRDRKKNKK